MSHGKIGFLIVTSAVLAISLPIIGLAYRAMPVSNYQNDPEPKQTYNGDRASPGEHPGPKPVGPIEHFIDALAGNVDRRPDPKGDLSEGDYRSEQDLVAQRIMARWTFGIFIFTGLSFVVVAIGTGLIYLTLRESRRLTGEAIKTTQVSDKMAAAAIEANQQNREAMIIQNRPWLLLESIEPASILNWHGDLGVLDIHVVFKNLGKTPARYVDVRIYPFSLDTGGSFAPVYRYLNRIPPKFGDVGDTIAQGRPFERTHRAVETSKGGRAIFIVRAEYKTLFDTEGRQSRHIFTLEQKYVGDIEASSISKDQLFFVPLHPGSDLIT